MTEMTTWPRKTRELQNALIDSAIWNEFSFRDHDVVVATYPKAGTTWMQQIVLQLLFGGDPDPEVWRLSPWLDLRVLPAAEKLATLAAQTHRASSRPICRSTRWCSPPKPATSTSPATGATSPGAFTTTP